MQREKNPSKQCRDRKQPHFLSGGQAHRLGGGGAARIPQLWGQEGIILFSGTQKAVSPMVPVTACVYPFNNY